MAFQTSSYEKFRFHRRKALRGFHDASRAESAARFASYVKKGVKKPLMINIVTPGLTPFGAGLGVTYVTAVTSELVLLTAAYSHQESAKEHAESAVKEFVNLPSPQQNEVIQKELRPQIERHQREFHFRDQEPYRIVIGGKEGFYS